MLANVAKIFFVVAIALFLTGTAFAADGVVEAETALNQSKAYAWIAAGIGAGLATIGGAAGIGRLAHGAMEGSARQPEAAGAIRVTMIIAAALIEGFTFFAIIVTLLLVNAGA